jgi:hypothetical protein
MKISQRQARADRKRVVELESILRNQKNRWKTDWTPGWLNIETLSVPEITLAKISTARVLGHAVIAVPDSRDNIIRFYAEPL